MPKTFITERDIEDLKARSLSRHQQPLMAPAGRALQTRHLPRRTVPSTGRSGSAGKSHGRARDRHDEAIQGQDLVLASWTLDWPLDAVVWSSRP
jgi:hypothetical protein